MKKLVNGKVVNIKNIEIFEKAAEGLVTSKIASSIIDDKITVESDIINMCIKHYEVIYKSMPFPLYAVENDVKHAAIATFIKDCMDKQLHMWIDDGLFIYIDKQNKLALKLVGNTWGVTKVKEEKADNTFLENFKDDIGYKEYEWLLRKIMLKESTSSFYTDFMPEFVKACNNEHIILKWELTNILTFGNTPEKITLKDGRILNLEDNSELVLDIYSAGKKKTDENEYVLSLIGKDTELKTRHKFVKTYKFDIYKKDYKDDVGSIGLNKIQKNVLVGLNNLFNTLCSIKTASEKNEFEQFSGFIADRHLIYNVDNRLFVCKAFRIDETKEIAKGVEIYSYDRGLVYFTKSITIGKGVKKEKIYSYSFKDNNVRLCKIQFVV